MYQNCATKVLTGEVRLSYANLITPRSQQQGAEPKYRATLLIPKTDTATKANIEESIRSAYEEGVSKKWGGARPTQSPILHDGDGFRPSGVAFGPECKGHWVITASTKTKPQVVHQSDVNTELAPQDIYSGMYGRVTINFYAYDTAGSKGVACGLGNVMKTRDGEPLSGGASAASDFAGVGNAVADQTVAPAFATEAPQYPTAAYAAPAPNHPVQPTYAQPAATAPNYPVQPTYAQSAATAQGVRVNPLTGHPM